MLRAGFAAAFATALCACVSVPLSTMYRLRNFDEKAFALLDPDVVSVRITLPAGFELDAPRSTLGVKLTSKAGERYEEFRLRQVTSAPADVDDGWFSAASRGTATELKLAADSKPKFRTLQAFAVKAALGPGTIVINPQVLKIPSDATACKVWIDLQLSREEGWFTLLEGADLPLDEIRAALARTPGRT